MGGLKMARPTAPGFNVFVLLRGKFSNALLAAPKRPARASHPNEQERQR